MKNVRLRALAARLVPSLVVVVFVTTGCQPTVKVRGDITSPGAGMTQAPPPTALVPTSPRPSAVRGRKTFEGSCFVCHGLEGLGNGPNAATLTAPHKDPMVDFFAMLGMKLTGEHLPSRPANFHNVIAMRLNAPFALFETIKLGRPHTAMPAFGGKPAYGANAFALTLKDSEIWDVLFYAWSFSTTPQVIALAKEIYKTRAINLDDRAAASLGRKSATCADCHGTEGNGRGGALSAQLEGRVWGWKQGVGPGIFTDYNLLAQRKPSELFQRIADGHGLMPSYRSKLKEDEIWALVDFVRTFMYEWAPARGQ
jgi:mono/diheme cytochrome c family protein